MLQSGGGRVAVQRIDNVACQLPFLLYGIGSFRNFFVRLYAEYVILQHIGCGQLAVYIALWRPRDGHKLSACEIIWLEVRYLITPHAAYAGQYTLQIKFPSVPVYHQVFLIWQNDSLTLPPPVSTGPVRVYADTAVQSECSSCKQEEREKFTHVV